MLTSRYKSTKVPHGIRTVFYLLLSLVFIGMAAINIDPGQVRASIASVLLAILFLAAAFDSFERWAVLRAYRIHKESGCISAFPVLPQRYRPARPLAARSRSKKVGR